MIGIHRVFGTPFKQPTAAVFLDRDGVLVEETDYLHKPEDVRIIPRVADAIRRLNEAHRAVVVVTNQAGIARQYYDWPAYEKTQAHIEHQLQPVKLDGVWACGYHPAGIGPLAMDHDFRKPNPGMILDAAAELNLDLKSSWLVGDKTIDIQAAINAGLAGAILVRTGYGRSMEAEVRQIVSNTCMIAACESLYEAVEEILDHGPL